MSAIFAAALARDAAAREPFLDEACAGEPALRRHIEALLTADLGAASAFEPPRRGLSGKIASIPATSLVGRQFGSFTILAPLGRGGMGEVYLARDGTLDRDVAIKSMGWRCCRSGTSQASPRRSSSPTA